MSQISIKLGPFWNRFCRPADDLELLGTVEQGAGIGALARTGDGTYWQINGDVRRKLNTSRIESVLRDATARVRPAARRADAHSRGAPTVTVKRRRTLERV